MSDNQEIITGTKKLETFLVGSKEAAKLLSISVSMFYGLHSSGRIGPLPIKLGRRSLWSRQELADWVLADCPPRHKWQKLKNIDKR